MSLQKNLGNLNQHAFGRRKQYYGCIATVLMFFIHVISFIIIIYSWMCQLYTIRKPIKWQVYTNINYQLILYIKQTIVNQIYIISTHIVVTLKTHSIILCIRYSSQLVLNNCPSGSICLLAIRKEEKDKWQLVVERGNNAVPCPVLCLFAGKVNGWDKMWCKNTECHLPFLGWIMVGMVRGPSAWDEKQYLSELGAPASWLGVGFVDVVCAWFFIVYTAFIWYLHIFQFHVLFEDQIGVE